MYIRIHPIAVRIVFSDRGPDAFLLQVRICQYLLQDRQGVSIIERELPTYFTRRINDLALHPWSYHLAELIDATLEIFHRIKQRATLVWKPMPLHAPLVDIRVCRNSRRSQLFSCDVLCMIIEGIKWIGRPGFFEFSSFVQTRVLIMLSTIGWEALTLSKKTTTSHIPAFGKTWSPIGGAAGSASAACSVCDCGNFSFNRDAMISRGGEGSNSRRVFKAEGLKGSWR